ncbi:MAG: hypothetical protein OJF60_001164 [Burkholderiaceae bacterium]|jgi:AraC-like DNA-binding protein|nr:MAG: hypothetical protein OJF60_001164 [Burkholderiaceae bacterium]
MSARRAVWIDLRCMPQQHGLLADAQSHCDMVRITELTEVPHAVAAHRPQFACIEYDYPDHARLAAVPMMRREFPALPVLMFTEYHSEALAVWAFRSRVWDYRVKPITAETLARQIEAVVLTAVEPIASHGWPATPFPRDLLAPAGHLRRPLTAAPRTAAAVAWISEHYGEPCPVGTSAGLCHLSESEFSRLFHREHGMSYRRFLLHYRIDKARSFLTEPQASVSQVAYAVGFNDLSHFGRMFRRIVGMPATRFQQQRRPHA